MAKYDWRSLRSKLQLERGDFVPANEPDMAQFEASTGFLLPKSYRDYCTTIGPGSLTSPVNYKIRVPGSKSQLYDLLSFHNEIRTYPTNYLKNQEQFKRAWFFARDIGNGIYLWDPIEVTRRAENEYAIYIIYEGNEVDRLADTFADFIDNICLTSAPPAYEQDEVELTFNPPHD
jgi:hypothetical protein